MMSNIERHDMIRRIIQSKQPENTESEKEKLRREIEEQTKEFLKKGGKIEIVGKRIKED